MSTKCEQENCKQLAEIKIGPIGHRSLHKFCIDHGWIYSKGFFADKVEEQFHMDVFES